MKLSKPLLLHRLRESLRNGVASAGCQSGTLTRKRIAVSIRTEEKLMGRYYHKRWRQTDLNLGGSQKVQAPGVIELGSFYYPGGAANWRSRARSALLGEKCRVT
jgi:hypothetical protein